MKIYPGAPHAFFNETNPATYREASAKEAWGRSLAFLDRCLK
jgi:carboxymethylenebutenolidase